MEAIVRGGDGRCARVDPLDSDGLRRASDGLPRPRVLVIPLDEGTSAAMRLVLLHLVPDAERRDPTRRDVRTALRRILGRIPDPGAADDVPWSSDFDTLARRLAILLFGRFEEGPVPSELRVHLPADVTRAGTPVAAMYERLRVRMERVWNVWADIVRHLLRVLRRTGHIPSADPSVAERTERISPEEDRRGRETRRGTSRRSTKRTSTGRNTRTEGKIRARPKRRSTKKPKEK